MAHLTFRVSDQLASDFEAAAASRGGKSRLLRSFVATVAGVPGGELEAGASRANSDKLTLRLPREDLTRLEAVAREAGMRRTEWAVACLRRRLLSRPQFNHQDSSALLATRVELGRISRQVRELVRDVRAADLPAGELEPKLAAMEAFHQELRTQLEVVRQALRGEASYWSDRDV